MTTRPLPITTGHLDHAIGERETAVIHAAIGGQNNTEIAAGLSLSIRGVQDIIRRVRERARHYGYAPETGATAGQHNPVRGESILYESRELDDGSTVDVERLRWVKTCRSSEDIIAAAREIVAGMTDSVPKAKPVRAPTKALSADLMNVHAVADLHLGMMASGEENGDEDWTLEHGEEIAMRWIAQSLALAPKAERGVLLQLGDFTHADGLEALTPKSKHVLDVSDRYPLVARAAVRLMRAMIRMMLERYARIDVVMAGGNHGPSSATVLREAFVAMYEAEPRIRIDGSPSVYNCLTHGETVLFSHHGDERPPKDLDRVFAGRFPREFGLSRFRYGHTAHRHHRSVIETELMQIEQHPVLIPMDAYAANRGYASQRAAETITYSATHGEVSRVRLTPEFLRQAG